MKRALIIHTCDILSITLCLFDEQNHYFISLEILSSQSHSTIVMPFADFNEIKIDAIDGFAEIETNNNLYAEGIKTSLCQVINTIS